MPGNSTRSVFELVTATGNGASLCWNLLRNNVEYASKLLDGRKKEEGIHVPAPFSQGSRIAPAHAYSLAPQFATRFIQMSHNKMPEKTWYKTEGMKTGKAEVLSDYMFVYMKLVIINNGWLKTWVKKTRHKA